jgi:hypothetical protein
MLRIGFFAALLVMTILAIAAPTHIEKRRTKYSGRGTWWVPSDPNQGGPMGACGGHLSDTAMIVALVSQSIGTSESDQLHLININYFYLEFATIW